MRTLIKNGRLIDPSCGLDDKLDLLIENGLVSKVGKAIEADGQDLQIIDGEGCFVMPGFIDLHVHFRDPGFEYKEDIETGSKAALRGGFTSVCAMPNTKPVVDNPEVVDYIYHKASNVSRINVLQVGAVTKGQKGEELSDIEGMYQKGIIAISEDGKSVMNSNLYREAMIKAKELGLPVLAHCEDINLVNGGVVNLDENAKKLGFNGISNAVEDIIAARDILLAKETGAKLHLCHCSTKDSVKLLKEAKEAGVDVTAEVCPHHFVLTSDDIKEDDANYKMNPPLRKREDVDALIEGLRNGAIDCIATDHAPHSREEKEKSIKDAPFGIVGLETAASLTYTYLVKTGLISPLQMAEKMSYNPARVIGIDKGSLQPGKCADVVIFNPNVEYIINPLDFESKGKNTPFARMKVYGKVRNVIVGGELYL